MKKDDIVKIILLISKKNIDYISKNDNNNLCIKKQDNNKFCELVDSYLDFLKQEEKFNEMGRLEGNLLLQRKEEYFSIAKKVDYLKNKIITLAKYFDNDKQNQINKITKRVLEDNNIALEKDFKITPYNIKNPKFAIYDFISSYIQILLFDEKNLKDINYVLGFDILNFDLVFNSKYLSNFFEENIWEEKKELGFYNVVNRTDKEIFYLRLEKLIMLYKLYKTMGISSLYKLDDINKELLEIYENTYEDIGPKYDDEGFLIKDKLREMKVKNAKDTDIFDILFDYDNMASNNIVTPFFTKNDLALIELTNEDGIFKDFSNKEIAYLLYGYFIILKKKDFLISISDYHYFKDLSEITELIRRRKIENPLEYNIEKTIDQLLRGDIKINLKDDNKIKR